MLELSFSVLGVRAELHAAVPTLMFRLRISESSGTPMHGMILRAQLQIQPRRRRHEADEQTLLGDLFGDPSRWGETLRPLLWTQASLMVPPFERAVEVDLPITCTYDMEVAGAKYLRALEDGEVPLLFLFSGTAFAKTENGFHVGQVPWDKEAAFRLPVKTWRELMASYFPGQTWIRLRRESVDALQRFKSERALMSWDEVIEALVNDVPEPAV